VAHKLKYFVARLLVRSYLKRHLVIERGFDSSSHVLSSTEASSLEAGGGNADLVGGEGSRLAHHGKVVAYLAEVGSCFDMYSGAAPGY